MTDAWWVKITGQKPGSGSEDKGQKNQQIGSRVAEKRQI
jgi:hypothetical protein